MINLIPDSSQWEKVQCVPILPPFEKKLPRRRKKKRKRGVALSKVGIVMKCRNCKEIGHNTRTCKNSRGPDPIRVPTRNTWESPRKNAIKTNRVTTDALTSTPLQGTASRVSGGSRERGRKKCQSISRISCHHREAHTLAV